MTEFKIVPAGTREAEAAIEELRALGGSWEILAAHEEGVAR